MYLNLLFLPLISSITAGLFGRKIGPKGSVIITICCLGMSFLTSLFIFYEVALVGCCTYVKLMTWIDSELFNTDWGFMFDSLTSIMCCVVTFVSFLVHLYSSEYMANDPHLSRFMSYLSLMLNSFMMLPSFLCCLYFLSCLHF